MTCMCQVRWIHSRMWTRYLVRSEFCIKSQCEQKYICCTQSNTALTNTVIPLDTSNSEIWGSFWANFCFEIQLNIWDTTTLTDPCWPSTRASHSVFPFSLLLLHTSPLATTGILIYCNFLYVFMSLLMNRFISFCYFLWGKKIFEIRAPRVLSWGSTVQSIHL